MVWNAFEIGVNLFEAILFLLFLKNRLHIARKKPLADFLCAGAYTAFLSLYVFYPVPVPDTAGCLILFAYACHMSDERWTVCALWVMINEIVVFATVSMTTQSYLMICSQRYDALLAPGTHRLYYVLVSNLAMAVALLAVSRIKRKNTALDWTAILLFLLVNALILTALEVLFFFQVRHGFEPSPSFLALDAILAAISGLSMVSLYMMTTISNRQHQTEMALHHARLTRAHQQTLKELYAALVARQHDFKHQLQTLERLMASGNTEEAQRYFNSYRCGAADAGLTFVTGNLAMDALLTSKALACQSEQIAFEYTAYPLGDLPIPEVDFCAVVGNLLDNAMEGAARVTGAQERRWVRLAFSRMWDMFTVTCENSMRPSAIRKRKGRFISSKKGVGHGYGIQSVIRVVDAFGGLYRFEAKGDVFTATLTLPYPPNPERDSACSPRRRENGCLS